jgi:hypothetical protein
MVGSCEILHRIEFPAHSNFHVNKQNVKLLLFIFNKNTFHHMPSNKTKTKKYTHKQNHKNMLIIFFSFAHSKKLINY